jgi:hypothetical protein
MRRLPSVSVMFSRPEPWICSQCVERIRDAGPAQRRLRRGQRVELLAGQYGGAWQIGRRRIHTERTAGFPPGLDQGS